MSRISRALRFQHLSRWRPPRFGRGPEPSLRVSLVAAAAIAGAVFGTVLATDGAAEAMPWLGAWITDRSGARSALATMLGIQLTLVTIILAITTLSYQSIASQYSPLLSRFISPAASLYREIPLFVLSITYTAAGVRQLGLAVAGPAPRPVVLGALILLLVALISVLAVLARTFRRLQVEEILHRTRCETEAVARRLARARSSLPAKPAPPLRASPESIPLVAQRTGYLVGFDVRLIFQLACRHGLRVQLARTIGRFVVRGESLGWFLADGGAEQEHVATVLARGVHIDRRRSSFLDVDLGLRILADIANRGLSPGVNDPTTACQALHQMRAILRDLAAMPLGDAALADESGEVRVSLALPKFRDYLATALDGPSRYGAGDPDVVSEILDLALEVGQAVDIPDRRAAASEVAARAVASAAARGAIESDRLGFLRDKVRAVELETGASQKEPVSDADSPTTILEA